MSAFAQEVFQDYPEGFLFQDAIVQHEDMTAMTGGTTGTIRVVTTRDANGDCAALQCLENPFTPGDVRQFLAIGVDGGLAR